MPVPKDYRPRRGDVVTIQTVVSFDYDGGDEWVHLKTRVNSRYGGPSTFTVSLEEIAHLVSRKWDEGMPVRNASDYEERGTVVVSFDGWVVVKPLPGSETGPWIFSNTEVEDDPTPTPAAPDALAGVDTYDALGGLQPPPAPRVPEDDEAAAIAAGEARAAAQE